MYLKYPIFFIFFFLSSMSFAQSLAYKALLNGVYEKDFPVVKIGENEILGSAIFLDAREKEEYEVSHLKGAKWVGHKTFSLDSLTEIPKDQPVVVYCSIGARSQEIGKKLQEAGFTEVYNLYGGVFHWVNEGQPIYNKSKKTDSIHAYSHSWGIWLNKGKKVY
ncbi:rhodanese-like domain-containing protein [Belliella marina]|uniref:Rhodanese-like domain-containing protein n=1 Tax=Belliella marina TaxID=1644146 RepID=A0ABW4VR69_9BACT